MDRASESDVCGIATFCLENITSWVQGSILFPLVYINDILEALICLSGYRLLMNIAIVHRVPAGLHPPLRTAEYSLQKSKLFWEEVRGTQPEPLCAIPDGLTCSSSPHAYMYIYGSAAHSAGIGPKKGTRQIVSALP